ncbi:ATP-dependent DNA helicase RecG [Proteiniborus sp. MB09-C3]|nr:ATP-dependent DNA helicase RecG [Proteiniborus sp. MB09-C3]WIV10814.1 ATP-dependent DNA helicase RecG [Proteiniborus sp. MB09-C3]
MEKLEKSVQYIKGVGPKKAKLLSKMGIETIEDIFYNFPRAYEDRREIKKISTLENGEKANVKVIICGTPRTYRPRKNMSIIKLPVKDETGIMYLTWFNQDYIINNISMGDIIVISGRVKRLGNQIEMQNPIYEKYNESGKKIGRVVPIYQLTEGLTNNELTKIVEQTIDTYLSYTVDAIPQNIIDRLGLFSFNQAIKNIHFPEDRFSYKKAKERLVFEELLFLQLGLFIIKGNSIVNNKGIIFSKNDETSKLLELLPYKLTSAQTRVFNEIARDMESPKQMNRLVQGDVGSGKTIIAVLSMLKAFNSGYQSVMMAPTEILATQHYESIKTLLDKFNICCELLTSNIAGKKKADILSRIETGEVNIIIGTHAVLQENVSFYKLGLAITDEQHRFGVRQRATLSLKGSNPDILVMTATPIPRTLALILYGDLEVSIIDELPAGRKKIKTYAITGEMKERAYSFVREQVNKGRQAYIVCPLVEESDSINAQSANELYENLKSSTFNDLRLGLLHGQMKSLEKDNIMAEFKNGQIDVLVSTTVIEVGVNVPNANIMLIENAERFGLAQLHQLRGRVGRGNHQSYCILVNESKSRISKERMHIMEKTNDGFLIAEKDLQTRGPGEFFGTRQHGLPDLKIANLFSDINTLKISQKIAFQILEKDPNLTSEDYRIIKERILKLFNKESQLISFN